MVLSEIPILVSEQRLFYVASGAEDVGDAADGSGKKGDKPKGGGWKPKALADGMYVTEMAYTSATTARSAAAAKPPLKSELHVCRMYSAFWLVGSRPCHCSY
jgi:hypothetical protein